MKNMYKLIISTFTYPFLLLIVILIIILAISNQWNYGVVYGFTTIALVAIVMIIEKKIPLKNEWTMTKLSFKRDLKYLAVVAPTIALTKFVFSYFAIHFATTQPKNTLNFNILWGSIIYLIIFELFQY
jgi:hypothetical protein